MPSSVDAMTEGGRRDLYPRRLEELTAPELHGDERILAVLPYTTVPKRPKGPEGKVRSGVWQSWRRYRPVVVTDRRLLVFDTGRTPYPRALLAEFPLDQITMSAVATSRFGTSRFTLTLPSEGEVPFQAGRRDQLAALRASLSPPPGSRAP
jgi:hypothetical protein